MYSILPLSFSVSFLNRECILVWYGYEIFASIAGAFRLSIWEDDDNDDDRNENNGGKLTRGNDTTQH